MLERKKCVCVGGTTSFVNVDAPQPDKGITTRVAGERLDAAGVTNCKSVCIFAHGSAPAIYLVGFEDWQLWFAPRRVLFGLAFTTFLGSCRGVEVLQGGRRGFVQ